MSGVRVRKRSRPPLAYVSLEPNKVVVVPTDDIPDLNIPNSPVNQQFLQNQAEQIASPSSPKSILHTPLLAGPRRLRSRTIDAPTSPPLVTPPTRGATSVSLESSESLVHEEDRDQSRMKRTSWFEDHVMRPTSRSTGMNNGHSEPAARAERVRQSMDSDGPNSMDSSAQVDVIIPDEARSHLGQAFARRPDSRMGADSNVSLAELHHHDIVEHLDVIDAQISTVSHLSNAANSILIPPLSFYSRKPVITLPARLMPADEERAAAGDELDMHIEELLTRRQKLRRSLRGLWTYLKTPIGIVTAIYGVAVVFWGAAIVLFLAKMINLHDDYLQGFWVEISSQVVNGLFTVQGVGFLPWRIMDTWNILWISHFDRLDQRLRSEANLPPLVDKSDIPDPLLDSEHVQMLSDKQLESLRRHQVRFLKSQTWYRPHATETHKAFSIKYALAICFFIDFNSIFQILLCGCMWSLNRFQRPPWTTGSLIPLSFICGIAAGVLIWKGGEQSKKTEEVEKRLKEALEHEKGVLKERYGPAVAKEPTLLEHPPAPPEVEEKEGVQIASPVSPTSHVSPFGPISPGGSRSSTEWDRRRSSLRKSLNIEEGIPEEETREPGSTSSTSMSNNLSEKDKDQS